MLKYKKASRGGAFFFVLERFMCQHIVFSRVETRFIASPTSPATCPEIRTSSL